LRPKTGLDPDVAAYVAADPDFEPFVSKITDLLRLLLPRFVEEGKKYANIAIGCTGGRHRSVHVVQRLALWLDTFRPNGAPPWRVMVNHRELVRTEQKFRDETGGLVEPLAQARADGGRPHAPAESGLAASASGLAKDDAARDGTTREASARDASTRDAGTRDASTRDSTKRDSSARDASTHDAGKQDAGKQDGAKNAGTNLPAQAQEAWKVS
jgi:hypothetical protein